MKEEFIPEVALELNLERDHACFILPSDEGGGKYFLALVAIYFLDCYLLVLLLL